jgi:hypothetical protein
MLLRTSFIDVHFYRKWLNEFPVSSLWIKEFPSSNARGLCWQLLPWPLSKSLPLYPLPPLSFFFISFQGFYGNYYVLLVLPNLVRRMMAPTLPENKQTPFVIRHHSRSSFVTTLYISQALQKDSLPQNVNKFIYLFVSFRRRITTYRRWYYFK